MKNKVFGIIAFAAGAAGGYFTGRHLAKKKYESLADREVESVKEALTDLYTDRIEKLEALLDEKESKEDPEIPSIGTVKKKRKNTVKIDDNNTPLDQEGYTDYAGLYGTPGVSERISGNPDGILHINNKEETNNPMIYMISPEEFNESDNQIMTLFYYKDRVLSDDDFNIVDDVEGTIGPDALTMFGIHDEDCVYIRNDEHGIDYEILLDEREYGKIAPGYLIRDVSE